MLAQPCSKMATKYFAPIFAEQRVLSTRNFGRHKGTHEWIMRVSRHFEDLFAGNIKECFKICANEGVLLSPKGTF